MSDISTRDQLDGFVADLARSLDFDMGTTFDCDNIILCGMGGSGVTSDFVGDCCLSESKKPVMLIKFPDLPAWVGPRTLAVVSSYSGNTVETVEMYEQAKARDCTIIAVTSGGTLKDLAERDGGRLVLLPKGMHPRHAIGYMIGYTLAVLRSAGGPDLSEKIRNIIPGLHAFRDSEAVRDGSLAHQVAAELIDCVPVICSDISMQSVAFRWKTQVNENSKYVAFSEKSPEFVLKGMEAWGRGSQDDYVIVMLIGHEGGERMESAAEELRSRGIRVRTIRFGGDSVLEDMFRAIVLGDYISMYMADLRGIDAAEVRPVMQLKELLGQPIPDKDKP